MDKKIFQVQVASIQRNEDNSPDSLLYPLKSNMGDIFDEVPISNPLPPGIPLDIPVITLNSKNKIINCNLSKIRTDIFFNYLNDANRIEDQVTSIKEILERFIPIVFSKKEIVRVGIVFNLFIETKDPVRIIKEKYIQNTKLSHVSEIGVRYNRRSSFGRFTLNNLVDINSNAIFNQGGLERTGCVLQVDTNNLPVSDKLTDSEAMAIFEDAADYIKGSDILGE